ncbi:uncharacterized protein LOC133393869 [Anopheles gambiae]|uniref:Protein TsetseEP domain-containing protein n=1 Tax=Anopheles coluzzii TaxID=1518534 RepID=A0A6E8W7C8_ANOCL|nr:uncharacterized protein LOC133393869 [Anopheles gambiae]
MRTFCFALTILCAFQSILAYPRPDFAINGTVATSVTVRTAANELGAKIINAGNGTVELTSGYTELTTLRTALQFIGDEIVRVAGPLASQLTNLSTDNVGPIDTVYGAINTTILQFEALISGGLNGTIANITTATGNYTYIAKQFHDTFNNTKTTLGELRMALEQLRLNVTKAKSMAGTANPIPPAIILTYVPATTVNAVIAQIRILRDRVSTMTFVIDSSLENLKFADRFIFSLKDEIVRNADRYPLSYQAFQINLGVEQSKVYSILATGPGCTINFNISIQNELEANQQYTDNLAPKLNNLYVAYEAIATEADKTNTSFAAYSGKVPTLIGNRTTELALSLCPSLRTVLQVQIANAGYSDFCFSKYSSIVLSQAALTIDAFDVCFEKELLRLMNLSTIIERMLMQLSFNTADLLSNLQVCLRIADPTAEGACYTKIAPYYAVLATKVTAHTATAINLVNAETKASYNRLGACLYSSLSVTAVSAEEISAEASKCLDVGPQ